MATPSRLPSFGFNHPNFQLSQSTSNFEFDAFKTNSESCKEESTSMSTPSYQDSDVEAQSQTKSSASVSKSAGAAEYGVPLQKKLMALSMYFCLSLGLTLQSKMLLGKKQFSFPFLLTAMQTGMTAFGCYGLTLVRYIKPSRLGRRESLVPLAFSSLFTINIAISNLSLAMVSVAFHQILRSTVPVFTILIYRLYYSRSYSTATYFSLVPIIVGVGLVTYGEYYFTKLGFFLTLLGVVLAAIKTVVTNRVMTGSHSLPPMEFLSLMSRLAAVQSLIYAYFMGETDRFMTYFEEGHLTRVRILALLSNAFIAFLLNISSFQTNKMTGALTMTVCGNIKQVLTVLLGIILFNVKVGAWNGVGMIIALAGAAYYSKVELNVKREQAVQGKEGEGALSMRDHPLIREPSKA